MNRGALRPTPDRKPRKQRKQSNRGPTTTARQPAAPLAATLAPAPRSAPPTYPAPRPRPARSTKSSSS